ncbi:MAG TPA: hypothetical protein VI979_03260 [archaeon]|nr:hypothetical protein [archaeon]
MKQDKANAHAQKWMKAGVVSGAAAYALVGVVGTTVPALLYQGLTLVQVLVWTLFSLPSGMLYAAVQGLFVSMIVLFFGARIPGSTVFRKALVASAAFFIISGVAAIISIVGMAYAQSAGMGLAEYVYNYLFSLTLNGVWCVVYSLLLARLLR